MWKVTIKGLRAHRVRFALTGLAIVLGVGFVAGTLVLTDTMRQVFDDLVRSGNQDVAVYVRGTTALDTLAADSQAYFGAPPFDEELLDDVRAVDGVADAAGSVAGLAQIITPSGEAITPTGPPTLGVSWVEPPLADRVIREGGRPPQGPDDVVVDARTADSHDLEVGDRIHIVFATIEPREFTIVGISTAPEGENLAGATLAQFDLATSQEVLGLDGRLTSVFASAEPDVSPEVLADRVATVLPESLEVVTATAFEDELVAQIHDAIGFFTIAFGVFAAVALFVGAFIIANTFSIVVVQRTRELALLRTVGASRGQVLGGLVGEAVVVGVVASFVGIAAGVGLAAGLNRLLAAFGMDMPTGRLVVAPRTVAVGLVVGLTVTVLSSLLPARRAARIHPIVALREVGTPAYRPGRSRLTAGVLVAATGLGLVALGVAGTVEPATWLVGAGAALTLAAASLLGPVLTRPVVRLFGGSGRRLGTVARLGRSNAMRTPRRTWATASALTIGLTLVTLVAVLAASMKTSVAANLEETMRADVVVTAGGTFSVGSVPPVVTEQVRDLPEVGAVSPVRVASAKLDGSLALLTAVDPTAWDAVHRTTFTSGSTADLLAVDTVAVEAGLAAERGLVVGDEVVAVFMATGTSRLRVVGIYERDDALGGWLISTATHDHHVAQPLDATLLIAGAASVPKGDVRAAVEQVVAAYPSLRVQDQAEYRDDVAAQVDQLLALVTALLGMALVIAVLGIMNTLALSVHERTREIGLLRAVGMLRRQVRAMIRWEAVIIAVLGALVGVALGTGFGLALASTLAADGVTRLGVPWGQLAVYLGIAAIAGVLAALLPARRAARLDVLTAVTVE